MAKDVDSYQYLHESIVMHPDRASLKDILAQAGFKFVNYHNYCGGIVAVHVRDASMKSQKLSRYASLSITRMTKKKIFYLFLRGF